MKINITRQYVPPKLVPLSEVKDGEWFLFRGNLYKVHQYRLRGYAIETLAFKNNEISGTTFGDSMTMVEPVEVSEISIYFS